MAHTLEITNGVDTYTFDVQPRFKPSFDWERNEAVNPPVTVVEIESWVLEGAVFRGTEAAVGANFEQLRALIGSRTPITSAKFKRDASVERELSTTTHKGGVFARGLEPADQPGMWASHWQGTVVIYGRKFLPDGDNIVTIEKELSYTYDSSGLSTVKSSGTLTTVPGTSARTKAEAQALASPGAAFGALNHTSADLPSVVVLDPDTDTRARWESTWREHGESLPSGANEWSHGRQLEHVPGEGEVETIEVRAKGPTLTSLRTAVRQKKPAAGLVRHSESEDKTALEYSGTFVVERSNTDTAARTGSQQVFYWRHEIAVDGATPADEDERDVSVELIPGYEAAFTLMPRDAIRVTEKITSRIRGVWSSRADFMIDPQLRGKIEGLRFQPGGARISAPILEKQGLTTDADVWRVEATYVYVGTSLDLDQVFAIAKEQ